MTTSARRRPAENSDGRVRRGERNREAIVAALFELIGEGVPQPTALQVAERASVNIRTVFRHFSEMESLYAAIDARLRGDIGDFLAGRASSGTVDERARELVCQRCRLFAKIAPYKRASNLRRSASRFLTEAHRDMVRELRRRLLLWLPELRGAPEARHAVELLTSFEAWDRLRVDQGLGRDAARAAMERGVLAVLREC